MIVDLKAVRYHLIFVLMLMTPALALAISTVVINELHIDPDVKTDLVEFIELYNPGTEAVDLSNWSFTEGVFYSFPGGTQLSAGGYLIVAQDPAAILSGQTKARFSVSADRVFGPYAGKLRNEGETVTLCNAHGDVIDSVTYKLGFPWPTVGDPVPESQPGTGYSMQLIDPTVDNALPGYWRSGAPTPAAENSVHFLAVPPAVNAVKHAPNQPRSGQIVTITADITNADSVLFVALDYQIVEPGQYRPLNSPQYSTDWVSVRMTDDGLNGDAVAGDGLYTYQVPASVQVHRRLIRYRISVVSSQGYVISLPYADDPQPNFAYFVYDGVPPWRGAVQPGVTPEVTFPSTVMASLPVYHLISSKSDVEDCTWRSKYAGSDYRWYGTLVYDGQVYDHIGYRARGGVWRYAMGKNMWKFDFNRGHAFQARDDYGNKYDEKWNKLNFSACIQQGSFGQRGEQGMFEALSFKLFNMVGVPACRTNYVEFRIIDEANEDGTLNAAHPPLTASGTQYDGDFWGLYMTIEQMDGRFLDEHGLPDGNLYKMDNSNHETNNQGPTQPSDQSDLNAFLSRYSGASADWWTQNANLDVYYAYYAIYQAIHHGDITGKNWFLYHNPETDRWWQLPWDLDLTWTTYYGSDDPSDPWSRGGLLNNAELSLENKNRLREIVDLMWNPEQTGQLIDEYAAIIDPPGVAHSMVDADCAMWDYHWVMGDGAYPTYLDRQADFKAGQGRFYEEAAKRGYARSFEGMVQVMKDYITERASHMNNEAADSAIPDTPTVTSLAPDDFPINALTFQCSPFSDPQGAQTYAGMQWRIAEIEPGLTVPEPVDEGTVLIPDGAAWRYFKGTSEPSTSPLDWRLPGFDDSQWAHGDAPVGYGESFIVTELSDMRGGYSTFYVRKEFDVADLQNIGPLKVEAMYDDGINIWINGVLVASENVSSGDLPYTATTNNRSENHNFTTVAQIDAGDYLVEGTNVICAQLVNQSLGGSSDCFFDLRLTAEPAADDSEPGPSTPSNYSRRRPKYEIDSVWASGELTEFNDTVTIPASFVKPGKTYRVRCRMKDTTGRWSHWSVPVQFVAGQPLAVGAVANLRVTEVMYNPSPWPEGGDSDNDDFEFIELKNIGDETLDLTTVSLTDGVAFDFANSQITSLEPGQFALVVRNRDAMLARYGGQLSQSIAGQYEGKLSNNGETVALVDYWNGTIAQFEYNDGAGWPLTTDGAGHSLVPLDSAILTESQGSLDYPGNWRASTYMGGSPGADDPTPESAVAINELMAGSGSGDWIELYNAGDASVDLAGWYLSDDIDQLKKWAVNVATIGAHSFVSFDESADNLGFGLSRSGETLFLSHLPGTGTDRIVDCLKFEAQEEGISLGRYPDGGPWWFRMAPSRDAANVEPLAHAVIDEVMFHPADANDEYIELLNPTDDPVDLFGPEGPWQLGGAVDYTFPDDLSIPPGGRVLVVGFQPYGDIDRLARFLAAYDETLLTKEVTLLGPWEGMLANEGERSVLSKPQASDEPNDPVDWVTIDELIYSPVWPWPQGADGQGQVLQRIDTNPGRSGMDPANWQAATPTPGTAPW